MARWNWVAAVLPMAIAGCPALLSQGGLTRLSFSPPPTTASPAALPSPEPTPTAGGQATLAPTPSPIPTPSLVRKSDVRLGMGLVGSNQQGSGYFVFATGLDTSNADAADIQFVLTSGVGMMVGLGIEGRRTYSFADLGNADLASIPEAPETGYSTGIRVGGLTTTTVSVGRTYVIRIETPPGKSYAKLRLRQLSAATVLFDYAYQTATGSRALE